MPNSAISFNTAGLASATSPGLVGTGAQTFAGDKTFNGLVSASGGIINTGLTGANATTVTTSGSGKVGEIILTQQTSISANSGISGNLSSLALPSSGIWLVRASYDCSTSGTIIGGSEFFLGLSNNTNSWGTGIWAASRSSMLLSAASGTSSLGLSTFPIPINASTGTLPTIYLVADQASGANFGGSVSWVFIRLA